jgi:hypothetical protein
MAEVHPHFNDSRYAAFVVLTQTCDLVRRNGERCRSRYINLAVVRPLRDVLFGLLDRECERARVGGKEVVGVYTAESKTKAEQLLARIVNQNAQAEGLFYLHKDAGVRIVEPCVALLQVSVAVRAYEHYGKLVEARSGSLRPEFQGKLGWLIGNLYSRVATRDMAPHQLKEVVDQFIGPANDGDQDTPQWVPRSRIMKADKAQADVEGLSPAQAAAELSRHGPEPPREVALARVVHSLRDLLPEIGEDNVNEVRRRLEKDPVFISACR